MIKKCIYLYKEDSPGTPDVYCEYHGSVDGTIKPSQGYDKEIEERQKEEFKGKIIVLCQYAFFIFITGTLTWFII